MLPFSALVLLVDLSHFIQYEDGGRLADWLKQCSSRCAGKNPRGSLPLRFPGCSNYSALSTIPLEGAATETSAWKRGMARINTTRLFRREFYYFGGGGTDVFMELELSVVELAFT